MKTNIPTYAYFYPLSTRCAERNRRASELGVELPDETLLCQQAEPMYPGHQQPQKYCLGDPSINTWDDADTDSMRRQIELASNNGLDGFIFDIFIGNRGGEMYTKCQKYLMAHSWGVANLLI